jgi:hypothetical protein
MQVFPQALPTEQILQQARAVEWMECAPVSDLESPLST